MGGIKDEVGIEQGGVHSSDLYTLYNNEHLDNVQDLKLGVSVYDQQVSTLAIADDVALISDNIFFLKNILRISLNYCKEFHVSLATEKTKLLAFYPKTSSELIAYIQNTDLIKIDDIPIKFETFAEHVGIIRSNDGNLPHLLHIL